MKYKRDIGYNKKAPLSDYPTIFCKDCGKKIPNIDKYIWIEQIQLLAKDNNLCNNHALSRHDLHTTYDLLFKNVSFTQHPTHNSNVKEQNNSA